MILRITKNNNDIMFHLNVVDKKGNQIDLNGPYIDEVRIIFYTTSTKSSDWYELSSYAPKQPQDFVDNKVILPAENLCKLSNGELMIDFQVDFSIEEGVTDDNTWRFHKIVDTSYYIVNDFVTNS